MSWGIKHETPSTVRNEVHSVLTIDTRSKIVKWMRDSVASDDEQICSPELLSTFRNTFVDLLPPIT